ncbi:GDSL-type esterase/lipase family protein [Arthrobacter sp. D5-1]|uniref:SGNH/GDSL hydrolase family protein n=1 Tax=Arthrobacter sp. D5-1 TaxID=1477518 RepID=UPI001A99C2CA|nr:GDSL-type esterase/lipase family protein [Arthrobacter sp. D5-1]QSZ47242.1 hypothetical protein AYX22_01625 [Arthrobacter sp. D5-1]
MTQRIVSVGDDFALPTGTKVLDSHLPTRLTPTALDAKFAQAAVTPVPMGNRVVFLGDSLTVREDREPSAAIPNPRRRATSIANYASMLSKQRINYVWNAGYAGDTSAMMLARFDADVTPYKPSAVFVLAGANDSKVLTPLATYKANMMAIFAKCKSIGARPILATVTPDSEVAKKPYIARYNAWLRRHAAENGYLLVDLYKTMVDPATGNIQAAYDSDGTHFSLPGIVAAGTAVANTLAPQLPDVGPALPWDNVDPANKITNGLFTGPLGVTSGYPSGWLGVPGPAPRAGITTSTRVATGVPGAWFTMTASAFTTSQTLYQDVSAIPGHRYAFVGRVNVTGIDPTTNPLRVSARMNFNASSVDEYSFRAMDRLLYPVPDGTFYIEGVAPSDATTVRAMFYLESVTASNGVVEFAQVSIMDLTDLGLA